ncbi:MAG: hypothetical protein IM585_12310 [Pseudanabaena sp. M135S2SP2A07QC]|nr:hypothetical protein [Pseudanabaena sp. M090S1SP2A07QC]MCA6507122.1 hypothetical protein [Pseudanabaena sp. M172S2SP2A07QC]MCA6523448.1 hypothetical protein [Pseudanabaena sp. M051S1SP2A07QC]MCA6525789.1 hypothetical protein [Pseudanabaena sp. M179S2SP2A07QC]MCA6530543.1 hypothetical protein [Pseudanabaena sp. M125S2SP2A07QC]MCA6536455.1 hypothetical protein [Pseudanabaena sp. M176S2SP2A07QC]MCA6537727.1 hypothetical protein [Pseudanabaena sp. M037S2SP2A07QC]MCA6541941.1 hypothetical prot
MNVNLKNFLEITDLDELSQAKNHISVISQNDQAAIIKILQEGANIQAIANLLMYPDLIPENERIDYILAGLRETNFTYLVLASVVGLGQLNIEALPVQLITQLIEQIINVTKSDSGVIAERASVFLAERLWHFGDTYTSQIIELLDHPSKVVQHNTLVALIPLVGLENIRQIIENAVQHGVVSEAGQLAAEQKLSEIAGFSKDSTIDDSQFDVDLLSAPLLAYIPNLDEMSP